MRAAASRIRRNAKKCSVGVHFDEYTLDSNICIYMIKEKPPGIQRRVNFYPPGHLGMSVITFAELRFGVSRAKAGAKNAAALENLQ